MGYRSDVKLAFYCQNEYGKQNFEWLHEFVSHFMGDEMDEAKKFSWYKGEGILFTWDYVKWYEDYADVQKVQAVIDEYNNTFCRGKPESMYAFEFIRIGEEDADIEKRDSHNSWGLLCVKRSIEFSDPTVGV